MEKYNLGTLEKGELLIQLADINIALKYSGGEAFRYKDDNQGHVKLNLDSIESREKEGEKSTSVFDMLIHTTIEGPIKKMYEKGKPIWGNNEMLLTYASTTNEKDVLVVPGIVSKFVKDSKTLPKTVIGVYPSVISKNPNQKELQEMYLKLRKETGFEELVISADQLAAKSHNLPSRVNQLYYDIQPILAKVSRERFSNLVNN